MSSREPLRSLTTPSHCGKAKVTPLYFGLGAQMAGWCYVELQRSNPRSRTAALGVGSWSWTRRLSIRRRPAQADREQLLGLRKQRQGELQLRVDSCADSGTPRPRRTDRHRSPCDHRPDEGQVLLPGGLVPLDRRLLHESLNSATIASVIVEVGRQLDAARRAGRDARVALAGESPREARRTACARTACGRSGVGIEALHRTVEAPSGSTPPPL